MDTSYALGHIEVMNMNEYTMASPSLITLTTQWLYNFRSMYVSRVPFYNMVWTPIIKYGKKLDIHVQTSTVAEVWGWINNFTPHFTGRVIIYTFCDRS